MINCRECYKYVKKIRKVLDIGLKRVYDLIIM